MLYLKRKSDGAIFPIWKYINNSEDPDDKQINVWVNDLGKIMIPSDEYELIFKP